MKRRTRERSSDIPSPAPALGTSLVLTVAFQLIDEGALDPTLTVDQWVPTLPNADRVTVQMLIDDETGWSDSGVIEPDPVVSDFARAWSLREAAELRATAMTALDEPGTPTDDGFMNFDVLNLVVEEVGGRPLADLVRDRVAGPAGLDGTGLLASSDYPAGYRHGVFAFDGTPVDTSIFDPTSYLTWEATHSAVSTPTDLLGLLDVWAAGELFETDRTPTPQRFVAESDDGAFVFGSGVPFNGFCPCAEVHAGFEPEAFGRAPRCIGTTTVLLRYADGLSVVVNVNTNGADSIVAVADAVHGLAAAAN